MEFRQCESQDAAEVTRLFQQVFTDSEGPAEGELIGKLASELQSTTEPEDLLGFVAKDAGSIVGCIFFTRLVFEPPIPAWILAPVAVATDYQRLGVGQGLINYGIEQLKVQPQQQQITLLLTYGDPNFYQKVGFQPISDQRIKPPFKLTYPHGWLGQTLDGNALESLSGSCNCVAALSDPQYW